MTTDALSAPHRAIARGIDALRAMDADLEGALGASFVQARDLALAAEGHVIVVGVGKSGHIGGKLAATFASTGTPAFFVHPTEASHGDLGMIRKGDVLILLSWSGETKELSDIIAYAGRFSIPMIGITAGADSMLAKAADVSLLLPRVEEACPHNLAPTTSTLQQMAIGDALAIALLEARGFSADDFRGFHPGGKLGARLASVSDLMVSGDDLPLIDDAANVYDGLAKITEKGKGIVGITDHAGKLAGVITDGDIRRHLESHASGSMKDVLWNTKASEIMTKQPQIIAPNRPAATALAQMESRRISSIFVVDEAGVPVGLVTFLRLLQAGVA
ncbi:KpsF/GutQ family sugar-phosphate isomerase [Paracoccaceae bacterium GXU_MW_L88]